MIQTADFKTIFDTLSLAVAVGSPVRNDRQEITDFCLEYMNASFSAMTAATFKPESLLSAVEDRLSADIDWQAVLKESFNENKIIEKTFYSFICKCFIKMRVNSVASERIAITIFNVSEEKEAEQQLRRQNSRLATLTEELSESNEALQEKLEQTRSLNEQLQQTARYDKLTGLRNRASMNAELQEAISKAKTDRQKLGLLFLDLDNLKNVNNAKGHAAGDELLVKTGAILCGLESDTVMAFRFGSDEFIIVKKRLEDKQQLLELGLQLIKTFNSMGLGLSGSITVYPDDSEDAEELLKYADITMCEAKKNGKNQICIFQQVMRDKFLQKVNIEDKLSKAMADKLFQLYYQPQFDVNSGKLRGFEALLRWHDDELGWVSPEHFIPLAEESRLVIPIGDWVMETAINTLAQWEREKNFEGILSVNVSPLQFKEASFLDKIRGKITKSGIKPQHLEVEITEGILIDNFNEILEKLNKLKEMGIGISLDDFGTGYSSMRYLQTLPLTTLKIDKSFISNINPQGDNKETEITESIVELVSKMGLDTIAEGVETDEQLNTLRHFHSKKINVQGFLKGKPMPKELCDRMLSGDNSVILTGGDDDQL